MLFYFIFVFLNKSNVIRRKKSDRSKDFPMGAKRRSLKGIRNKERDKAKPLAPKKKRKSNIRVPSLERKAPEEEKNKEKAAPLLQKLFSFQRCPMSRSTSLNSVATGGKTKTNDANKTVRFAEKIKHFSFLCPDWSIASELVSSNLLVSNWLFSYFFHANMFYDSCLGNFGFTYISKYIGTKKFLILSFFILVLMF